MALGRDFAYFYGNSGFRALDSSLVMMLLCPQVLGAGNTAMFVHDKTSCLLTGVEVFTSLLLGRLRSFPREIASI